MNFKKIITIVLIFFLVGGVATMLVAIAKPKLHNMVIFEQIIFKRSK